MSLTVWFKEFNGLRIRFNLNRLLSGRDIFANESIDAHLRTRTRNYPMF